MSQGRGSVLYETLPSIRWLVDDDRVIVVDEAASRSHVFQGTDAMIWRSLSLSQDYERLVDLLQRIWGLSRPDAERDLRATLECWTECGVIRKEIRAGHG
jgi:hypothetical protein